MAARLRDHTASRAWTIKPTKCVDYRWPIHLAASAPRKIWATGARERGLRHRPCLRCTSHSFSRLAATSYRVPRRLGMTSKGSQLRWWRFQRCKRSSLRTWASTRCRKGSWACRSDLRSLWRMQKHRILSWRGSPCIHSRSGLISWGIYRKATHTPWRMCRSKVWNSTWSDFRSSIGQRKWVSRLFRRETSQRKHRRRVQKRENGSIHSPKNQWKAFQIRWSTSCNR